jgi:hypothetical protein
MTEMRNVDRLSTTQSTTYRTPRLAAAKNSTDPDSFRSELGAIGNWSLRDQVDDLWLLDCRSCAIGFFASTPRVRTVS